MILINEKQVKARNEVRLLGKKMEISRDGYSLSKLKLMDDILGEMEGVNSITIKNSEPEKLQVLEDLEWLGVLYRDGNCFKKDIYFDEAFNSGAVNYINNIKKEMNNGSKFKQFIEQNYKVITIVSTVILTILGWILT